MGVLTFRLFGFPTRIQPGFWLLALIVGWLATGSLVGMGWIAGILLLSVLAHELGHASMAAVFGQQPQIVLHMLGGLTMWRSGAPLPGARQVAVSLAGPAAGVMLGGIAYVLHLAAAEGSELQTAFQQVALINFVLSAVNLLPVLPFDGGQVLRAALGPRRRRLAAAVSMVFGLLIAMYFLERGFLPGALLFGLCAVLNLSAAPGRSAPTEESLDAALDGARRALAEGAAAQAAAVAQAVLEAASAPPHARAALEILAWSALMLDNPEGARNALQRVPASERSRVEPYLAGAVAEASGDFDVAVEVLSAARRRGDRRPEVAAVLVRALLASGRHEGAARLTAEILDDASHEDARRVAHEALSGEAFLASAELLAKLFKRSGAAEDAYAAARAFAQAGRLDTALASLEHAMRAGHPDPQAARADAALAPLKDDDRFEAALAASTAKAG